MPLSTRLQQRGEKKPQTKIILQEHRWFPVTNIKQVYIQPPDIYRATSTVSFLVWCFVFFFQNADKLCVLCFSTTYAFS